MNVRNFIMSIFVLILILSCAQPNEPAHNTGLLQIYDVIKTSGYAFDFDVSDELLFVAEDQVGFSIHNFVSGSVYCHVDTLFDDNPNPFENVRKIAGSIDYNFLMVYDRYGSPASYNIYDISDIQNPIFLFNAISNTSNVEKILLDESGDQLEIFWTNNNSLNKVVYENELWSNTATIGFPNSVNGFDFNDEMFVVAGYQVGVYFVDRNTEEIIYVFDTVGEALDVKLVDNLAFIALWSQGFLILDITDPLDPHPVCHHFVGDNIYTVDIKDDLLVLSSHSGGVFLYDISNLSQPELLGNLRKSDITYTYKATFENGFIAASTRQGLVKISY